MFWIQKIHRGDEEPFPAKWIYKLYKNKILNYYMISIENCRAIW